MRRYLDMAIPQLHSGEIDPGRVFDRTMSLEQTSQAYAAMDARQTLKVMLTP